MAKLNFKDLIFKFLQRDEDHDCEKVHPKMSHKEWMNTEPVSMHKEAAPDPIRYGPDKVNKAVAIAYKMKNNLTGATKEIEKIAKDLSKVSTIARALKTANEDYKSDYEKEQPIKVKKAIEIAKRMAGNYTGATKEIEKLAKGLSQLPVVKSVLMRVNEEAPANATGTAVAGTGDDSSTVVVRKKKKKELQSKLMRRLKIKEAIDKAIPDLEYPKDSIRERTEQLKGFAKEYKEDNRDDDVTGKKVFKPAKHMPKDSAGKLDVTEPTVKGSPLNKVAKVHNTNKARHSIMGTPSTQYKGLAFRHSVPTYTKA